MKTKIKRTENQKFDYKTIKTFEDACSKLNIDPLKLPEVSMLPEDVAKPIIAYYKLLIIYKAINNGWIPVWTNSSRLKYYPWYGVLSSGFVFSGSGYGCAYANTSVGSRLCTDTSKKALYVARQFKAEYTDFFLIP